MLPNRIEEASLNAWPALQQLLFDGWILRFAKGYTKRANSVNPLYGSNLDISEKVEVCEDVYAHKGLPPVFRLTSFSSPPDIDQVLESRGYWKIDTTFVLHLNLGDGEIQPALSGDLKIEDLDGWMDVLCRFSETSSDKHQTHKEILQAIPSQKVLVSLLDSGQPVACGLGVLEGDYFGLFDLITDPQLRNKGYGTQLVSRLLRWAQKQGAAHAYLQVMSANEPARHLYSKFKFESAYWYWYRVR